MVEKEIFSKRLSEAISDKGIKQKYLAAQVGCTGGTISKYLNLSAKEMPNAGILCEIAKELQISADWLLGLTDQKGIGNGLSLRDIARFLMACIDTPVLNAELANIEREEHCYDFGYEPESGPYYEKRNNTYLAFFFSEWGKDDALDDSYEQYGNHMCRAAKLNDFLKAYVNFRKLYHDGILTEDIYNLTVSSLLNNLSTAPITKI